MNLPNASPRTQLQLLQSLFDLNDSERAEHLGRIEREDAALAAAMREMLRAADVIVEQADADTLDALGSNTVVGGRFRLSRRLGLGGMGEVYLARRTDGIDQNVAVKILYDGVRALSRARAKREQQILARLSHPNIAGLIDAGSTEAGRPWFAMEYVDGEPLLGWCDHRNLGLVERVKLIAQICLAVQFAHRNLVLHRDLKPSNILVDREGMPKLLDFGIAKVIDTNDSRETQTVALTPAYAAPEQLRGEAATTAGDVYQLGIVLYELVSGVPAHLARHRAARDGEAQAALPKVHAAFIAYAQTSAPSAASIAGMRGLAPERLARSLKGDLGRIIAKASSPYPQERYATAQSLADDLLRWIAGEPVSAHRGTVTYRMRRFVYRHAVASLTVAVLLVGLVAASGFALDRAWRERQQRVLADRQRNLAEQQRARSDALLGFLRNVFQQTDPDTRGSNQVNASDLLERALSALEKRTDVDDATHAVLLTEVASAFANLGLPQSGLVPAQRALDILKPQRERQAADYLKSLDVLLTIYSFLGRYAESVALISDALPLAEPIDGGEHDWGAYLRVRRAYAQIMRGEWSAADADARGALAMLDARGAVQTRDGIEALNVLGVTLGARGGYAEEIDVEQRILDMAARGAPIDKSQLLTVRLNHANSLYQHGDAALAIAALEPALAETEAMVGPTHIGTVYGQSTLVSAYLAIGEPERARPFVVQLRSIAHAKSSQYARQPLYAGYAIALYDIAVGDPTQALARTRDTLDSVVSIEPSSVLRGDLRRVAAEATLQLGHVTEAATMFRRVLADNADASGRINRLSAASEDGLGRALLAGGDVVAAREHFERAIAQFSSLQGAEKPNTLRSEIHLLWATALKDRDPAALDPLQAKRRALVSALGSADRLQTWQLDLLIDALSREIGHPFADAVRRTHAQQRLRELAQSPNVPNFVGLSEF